MRPFVRRLLGLMVVLLAGTAAWLWWAQPAGSPQLRLTEVHGAVTLERAEAPAADAELGQYLQAEDRLETQADGRAVLTLAPGTHVRVGASSTLQIVEVNASGVALELEDGAVRATVRADSGAVRITNRGRGVLATDGDVAVGVRDGILQVRANDGEVALQGMDRAVLPSGQQATVVGDDAEVEPIPEDLLLAVRWPPTPARTREEDVLVEGDTAPGARVTVTCPTGVVEAMADRAGRFSTRVPLQEGENPCEVVALDAFGERQVDVGQLQVRDTRGPTLRGGVDYQR